MDQQKTAAEPKKRITLKRLSYIGTILSGVAAIVFGVLTEVRSGWSEQKPTPPKGDSTRIRDSIVIRDSTRIPPAPKKSFLGIKTSGETENNQLAQKLNAVFENAGYTSKETATGSESNFENIINANLVVTGPENPSAPLPKYAVQLTLSAHRGNSSASCASRTYSTKVEIRPGEGIPEITGQAVTDLMEKIRKESLLPLCIPKH